MEGTLSKFRGRYYHIIDDKGRIIFPAKMRETFAERSEGRLVITGHCGYLLVFPQDEWEILEEKISHQSILKRDVRAFQRNFMSPAVDCTLDSQGRILVPPNLREYAGLEKDIVIAGMVRTVEVWSKARWEKEMQLSGGQDYSETIGDLI